MSKGAPRDTKGAKGDQRSLAVSKNSEPAPKREGGKGRPPIVSADKSTAPQSREIAATIADEVGKGDLPKVKTSSEMFKGLHGHHLQVNHYATAIMVCAKDDNIEGAEQLWDRMREENLKPDLRCYRGMIAAHHRNRNWEKMLLYCNKMHANDIVADAQTYRAVFSSLEKAGQCEKVLSVAEEFVSSGLNIDLSLSCDSILGSCAKVNRLESAVKFWSLMKSKSIKPSEATYSTMMLLHVHADLPYQALHLMEEMDQLGVARTAQTELATIIVHAAVGQTDEALKILRQLVSLGVEVNLIVINMVLMAIEKDKRGDAVIDVIRAMRTGKIEPDSRGYAMMISTYSQCGLTEEALMVLRRMLNDPRNIEVQPSCVESVISACLEEAHPDEALQVLRTVETRMSREPIFVDDALVAKILECFTRQGRWYQVNDIFYEVRKRHGRSSSQMFHALLGAMKAGKNNEGYMEVLALMRSDGIEVSREVYEDATAAGSEEGKTEEPTG
jgi:pentatricopeptide repeat protein